MQLSDFDYQLPEELIAQYPPAERPASRLMVVDRDSGEYAIRQFRDFPAYLQAGDCLVFNDTKVVPARVEGRRKATGGKVEILFLRKLANHRWRCLLKPAKRLREGVEIEVGDSAADKDAVIVRRSLTEGEFEVETKCLPVDEFLEKHGNVPLPPYIQREADSSDRERYQTVYAAKPGAVAAPTAGLHFTDEIREKIRDNGVREAMLTLHVGPGTFQPVRTENPAEHRMHAEAFALSQSAAELINDTIRSGRRVVAVGTTSVRVLESCAVAGGERKVAPQQGETRLFLHPPKKPRITDALLTNFHLPRSTLLMLVATFSSADNILRAYRAAVEERMRFYSYGDCMLIIPGCMNLKNSA